MDQKVILYIAISQDGFIAGEDDSLDFLNTVQMAGEDYGYAKFIESIEAVVVGRKTYEKVISMGYPYHEDKEVYVITRSHTASNEKNLHYYHKDLSELIAYLKRTTKKNIYCDGGAQLAKHLIDQNQIDQIILSVVPLRLNTGTLLFEKGEVPSTFKLNSSVEFQSGLIQNTYTKAIV